MKSNVSVQKQYFAKVCFPGMSAFRQHSWFTGRCVQLMSSRSLIKGSPDGAKQP